MEESRPRRVEPAPARIRTVPIAVTPEGFWCCLSPVALHKSLKNPHHHGGSNNHTNKQQHNKIPSAPPSKALSVQNAPSVTGEPGHREAPDELIAEVADRRQEQVAGKAQQHKICIGFGQPETSDLIVMLYGKEGIAARMSVHRDVLSESSTFFAEKLAGGGDGHGGSPPVRCVEIHDCDDAEIYVETVGLMYCDEAKHKLLKQNISRVLRIMKMENSSLKECFHDPLGTPLNWRTRLQVAIDVATALEYLYYFCDPPVFHVTVNSSNVMMKADFVAKLSDVRVIDYDTNGREAESNAASFEDQVQQRRTELVFQYVVLVLELVTGQLPGGGDGELVWWVQEPGFAGSMHMMVDAGFGGTYDTGELRDLLIVARLCMRPCNGDVVSIPWVLRYLQGKVDVKNSRG